MKYLKSAIFAVTFATSVAAHAVNVGHVICSFPGIYTAPIVQVSTGSPNVAQQSNCVDQVALFLSTGWTVVPATHSTTADTNLFGGTFAVEEFWFQHP